MGLDEKESIGMCLVIRCKTQALPASSLTISKAQSKVVFCAYRALMSHGFVSILKVLIAAFSEHFVEKW